jgi:GTP-binding protein
LQSAETITQSPSDAGYEVAFAGRSNAGKSSFINTLTGINGLARTSKTPGRTRLLNFFELDESRRLVDLPGYGFAKVNENMRRRWARNMEEYLQLRQSLAGLVLVMDVRHALREFDWQMLDWCHHAQLPVHAVLTKADKLKRGKQAAAIQQAKTAMKSRLGSASLQLFSSLKHQGVGEIHTVLDEWFCVGRTQPDEQPDALPIEP